MSADRLGKMQAFVLSEIWMCWHGYSEISLGDFWGGGEGVEPWVRYGWVVRQTVTVWGLYGERSPWKLAGGDWGALRASVSRAVRRLCDRGLVELIGREYRVNRQLEREWLSEELVQFGEGTSRGCGRVHWLRLTPAGMDLLLTKVNNKPQETGLLDCEALVKEGKVRWYREG